MVTHIFNPTNWEAEVGRSLWSPGQPGIPRPQLKKKKKRKRKWGSLTWLFQGQLELHESQKKKECCDFLM